MSDLVPSVADTITIKAGHPVTTSLGIARVFRREHRAVLLAIKKLDCSEEFRQHNFVLANYLDTQGKPRPMVEMTYDGFVFLVMGFTGKDAARFKEEYIAAFNAMEDALRRQPASALASVVPEADRLREQVARLQEDLRWRDRVIDLQDYKVSQLEAAHEKPKRQPNRPISSEEAEHIRALAAQGLSHAEIARRTGRSSGSISWVVRGAEVGHG